MLGAGGMGTVWEAQDELLGRVVAIKEVAPPPELTEDEADLLRKRTVREASTAARISHPNVTTVYDVVVADDEPWIVMELVPSRSLSEVIAADGPMSPARVAQIGLDVLAALRTAHAAGVLHRDVKPGNVLLRKSDGRAVLTDFGIATLAGDPSLTRAGLLLGAPAYISPERARGSRGDPSSDLWALGATLYTAVEGRPPHDRGGPLPTLAALVTEDPPPPKHAGDLRQALVGMLRMRPVDRLASAEVEALLRPVAASRAPRNLAIAPRPASPSTAPAAGTAPVPEPTGVLPEQPPAPARGRGVRAKLSKPRKRAEPPSPRAPVTGPADRPPLGRPASLPVPPVPLPMRPTPPAPRQPATAGAQAEAAPATPKPPAPRAEASGVKPEPASAQPAATPAPEPTPAVRPEPAPPAEPAEPAVSQPTPAQPTPAEGLASQPSPAQPTPAQPTPAEGLASQPSPAQPTPAQPTPAQSRSGAQPTPGQGAASRPTSAQPASGAQPLSSQPAAARPMSGQPTPGQPTPSQPTPGQPAPSQPAPSQGAPGQGAPGQAERPALAAALIPVTPSHGTPAVGADSDPGAPRIELSRQRLVAAVVALVLVGVIGTVALLARGDANPDTSAQGGSSTSAPVSSPPRATPAKASSSAPTSAPPTSKQPAANIPLLSFSSSDVPFGIYSLGYPYHWGWTRRRQDWGGTVTFHANDGHLTLLMDHATTAAPDALADLKSKEISQAKGVDPLYPGYHLIRLDHPAELRQNGVDIAVWEFTYVEGGVPMHALFTNIGYPDDRGGYGMLWRGTEAGWAADDGLRHAVFESWKVQHPSGQ
jgi:eukaryotic-like serine/threonine-protein kinase